MAPVMKRTPLSTNRYKNKKKMTKTGILTFFNIYAFFGKKKKKSHR